MTTATDTDTDAVACDNSAAARDFAERAWLHYATCALWCSYEPWDDDDDTLQERGFTTDDITSDSERDHRAELESLAFTCWRDISDLNMSAEQFGHDTWLTRNGHGTGFWDRGYPQAVANRLTEAARGLGGCDPYVWNEEVSLG